MKRFTLGAVCAILCIFSLSAADRNLADGLAAAGAAHAAKGNVAQAKDVLYKALAYDTSCPDAVFELAKIFEKEGNMVAAGDFFQRASVLYSQEAKPANDTKRAEADRKVKALNPYAARLIAIYEDYAQELAKVVKKSPDSLTHDTAVDHVKELNLTAMLAADKVPLFYKDALAVASQPKAKPPSGNGNSSGPSRSSRTYDSKTGEYITNRTDNVAPEIARELKAAGWDVVKGTWVKKGPNVYEVTDGRLETKKTLGALDVLVWKGYTGSVAALVRDESTDTVFSSSSSSASRLYLGSNAGYGIGIHKDVAIYCPMFWSGFSSTMSSAKYESYRYNYGGTPLPDVPKQHIYVMAADTSMEMNLNDKKLLSRNDKNLPIKGQFIIEVDGKATLETPRAMGK